MNNQLEELKKELDEIKHKISEIEIAEKNKQRNNCLIKSPDQEEDLDAYYICDENTHFEAIPTSSDILSIMHFADDRQCIRYAEALTTFILLRKQPGSEAAKNKTQYIITGKTLYALNVSVAAQEHWKFTYITPCFNSQEAASKAIETVGEERILNMFKYFHS